MALRADVGTGIKAYNAQYSLDSSYCFTFAAVGLDTDRSGNPSYKRRGFFGFGGTDCEDDELKNDIAAIQFQSEGGICYVNDQPDSTKVNEKSCTSSGGTWKKRLKDKYGGDPKTCMLSDQDFKIGAYSEVSNLKTMIMGNERNVIREDSSKQDCWDL